MPPPPAPPLGYVISEAYAYMRRLSVCLSVPFLVFLSLLSYFRAYDACLSLTPYPLFLTSEHMQRLSVSPIPYPLFLTSEHQPTLVRIPWTVLGLSADGGRGGTARVRGVHVGPAGGYCWC